MTKLALFFGMVALTLAGQPQPRRIEPVRVQKKLALVIGNAAYRQAALKNPVHDADSMAAGLRKLGFEVTLERDLNRRDMERAVDAFAAKLQRDDFGLFYYSGHGQQIQQENYLLPVDFTAASEADVKYAAYSASQVRDKMESSGARLRVLILDACRDNPWRSTRGMTGGLAPMATAEGTLIAYATGDNRVADDNPGESNGLFTKHLITELQEPGLTMVDLFRRVKKDVYAASSGRQNPAVYDNIVGDFVVNDPERQRRRNQEEIAQLEGELREAEGKARAAQTERSKQDAERQEQAMQAKLEAARLEEGRLKEEAERRRFIEAESARREADRAAEEARLADLRRKLDEQRVSPAQPAMTLAEAQKQAARMRGQLAEIQRRVEAARQAALAKLDQDYAPLREPASKALVKDQFETTAAYQARLTKAKQESESLESRYRADRELVEKRYAAELAAEQQGAATQLEALTRASYAAGDMKAESMSYDADAQRLTVVMAGEKYTTAVKPERAKELYARRDSLRIGTDLESRPKALMDGGETYSLAVKLREPGEARTNAKDALTYVWIPAGRFVMGCSPGDGECSNDEKPAHDVAITRGFWLGQTEVTQEAYQKVTGKNPSSFKGGQLPVESVSWNDAKAYCSAIGGRLPTEAEWEYAARAGNGSGRYGSLDDIAWYDGNSGGRTHEVKQKQGNAWRLYDMLGNVWEWTGDWYEEKYYERRDGQDPQGPSSGQARVLRGGSWLNIPRLARVSNRLRFESVLRFYIIGFRCVGE